ncbi:MAG: hypothetical protein NC430_03645 [bacterium]|nr:hypothetical protein [bacterium]
MRAFIYDKRTKIVAIIIVQIIICVLVGTQKKSIFCDEIFSYGLANSENYTFINPETAKQYSDTGWVDQSYFESYLQVSKEVPFSFYAAFENQKNDVHPPLYYCIFHIFSLLNNGVFSKWTGLALNFVVLILIDLLMLYISNYLLKDTRLSVICLLFWSFSGAGLSNILFIRMYMMLTCEMLAYVAIHIKIFKMRKMGIKDILSILLLVFCGGLTHYYFYLFVACFSGPICIYLLLNKKIKKMILYGTNICVGVGAALCIFPQALMHIFSGYRGTEVISNLTEGRDGGVVKVYLELIDNSFFAGKFKECLIVIILLSLTGIITKYFVNIEWLFNKETRVVSLKFSKMQNIRYGDIQFVLKDEVIVEALLFLSYSVFALIAMKGSEIVHNRYLYPIYPIVALMVILMIKNLLEILAHSAFIKKFVVSVTVIGLCIGSIFKYGVDFMYTDYDKILQQTQEIRETDCLFYYGDGWFDIYTNFPLRLLHDETYIMRPDEIRNITDILSKRDTENKLTVCLPSAYSEEDTRNILDQIVAQVGAQGCRMIYRYQFIQEWIIE